MVCGDYDVLKALANGTLEICILIQIPNYVHCSQQYENI